MSKWDDNGNDVIVLAKHMCMIMMEMTDFTRGKGRLKTTMDVITAAKGISEAGTKLDKLARLIADQCPESTTKKDLLAAVKLCNDGTTVHATTGTSLRPSAIYFHHRFDEESFKSGLAA